MADEEAHEASGSNDSQITAEITARDADVTRLLSAKNKIGALKAALQNPPITTKNPEIKDLNAAVVEKVVASFTDAELPSIVAALDAESCDILMKYVYRLMAKASNCGIVLKLHGLISEKAGISSIVRVITDRKTV